jgi:hypothetical protein
LKKLTLREPLQVATGGVPLTLLQLVEEELNKFAKFGVKPVFVFSGLNMVRKDRPFQSADVRPQKRVSAWQAYAKGDTRTAAATFESTEKFPALNFLQDIFKLFRDRGVEYFRAPYLAWPQLAYFAHPKQNYIASIWSGLEPLLFGAGRVIVEVDWEKGVFEWVDFKLVLNQLGLMPEQFIDACILAGFDYCATFPPLTETPPPFSFRSAFEMVKMFKSGYNAVTQYNSNPNVIKLNYVDLFLRTKCLIRNHVIFESTGVAEPLMKDFSPSDLHEIIGPRFANEVYFLLSQGILNPQVLNNIVSCMLAEAPPLVESEEYRTYLSELMGIRNRVLSLVASSLGTAEWTAPSRRIVTVRWFEPAVDIPMSHTLPLPTLPPLRCSPAAVKTELARISSSMVADPASAWLLFCVQRCGTADPSNPQHNTTTLEETICHSIEFSLQLQNYITEDGHLTHYGKAFALGASQPEEAFVLLELFRTGHLHGRKLSTNPPSSATSDGPLAADPAHETSVRLLARVLSVLPAAMLPVAWDAPVSLDLAGFHGLVKALHRSLRNLVESAFLVFFMRGRATVGAAGDFPQIPFRLPFTHEDSTALGIAARHFLISGDLAKTKQTFPAFRNLADDLKQGFAFWDSLIAMLRKLRDEGAVQRAQLAEFEDAHSYLDGRRKLLSS